ncbi:RNA-directed DNA polymerase, eukaryota, partial [Tanacetum coccineum]
SWKAATVADTNVIIKMMKKLKYLQEKICVWNKTNKEGTSNNMRKLKADLAELDVVIDKGKGDKDVVNKRTNVVRSLRELEKLQSVEVAQKAKIKWAIEGDENSKYYHGYFPKGGNSSFITLIPKTHDANMVKDFRPISLIGSLYKIIAKLLANRLVVVLGSLVNEVQSAFVADRGSVIVNGSPTEEFQIYKGLKQGDPLSPFLFILVMESLQVSFQRVVDAGMLNGISLDPSLYLSHMFYADDAIFVGQWNESNINTIVHILDRFLRASGLRINMSKSKLLGISMDADKVGQAARKIGCVTLQTPFK